MLYKIIETSNVIALPPMLGSNIVLLRSNDFCINLVSFQNHVYFKFNRESP